jgi:hypothetical protein
VGGSLVGDSNAKKNPKKSKKYARKLLTVGWDD